MSRGFKMSDGFKKADRPPREHSSSVDRASAWRRRIDVASDQICTVCSAVRSRTGARGGAIVDESYLREAILDPSATVADGFLPVMPTFAGQSSTPAGHVGRQAQQ